MTSKFALPAALVALGIATVAAVPTISSVFAQTTQPVAEETEPQSNPPESRVERRETVRITQYVVPRKAQTKKVWRTAAARKCKNG
jgi:hypothetical protein